MKPAVLFAAVLPLLVAIVSDGPLHAQQGPQSEIFVPKKAPPPAPPPPPAQSQTAAPPRNAAPAVLSGCVRLVVQVASRDANGEAWDPIPGSTQPPDIRVYDGRTRARLFGCDDSYTCSGTVNAAGAAIDLLINDDDYDAPDFIGQGSCSLARSSCALGLARLRLSPC